MTDHLEHLIHTTGLHGLEHHLEEYVGSLSYETFLAPLIGARTRVQFCCLEALEMQSTVLDGTCLQKPEKCFERSTHTAAMRSGSS